jgi:hypothetical protein
MCVWCSATYDIDVLPIKFLQQLRETITICINPDGFEHTFDIVFGGAGVAGEAEEEIRCEVLHFGSVLLSTLSDLVAREVSLRLL